MCSLVYCVFAEDFDGEIQLVQIFNSEEDAYESMQNLRDGGDYHDFFYEPWNVE